jgi:AraC-like DNA-binding protein
MAVKSVFKELGIEYLSVELGVAKLATPLSPEVQKTLDASLRQYELELMADRKKILVERIKLLVLEQFRTANTDVRLKFSELVSKTFHYDYTYLANIFSELEGSTIERFYIVSRIERVKELIVYEGMNVTEIAYYLNYSSVSHLCLQFKKVTGQTPSAFKKQLALNDYVWKNNV